VFQTQQLELLTRFLAGTSDSGITVFSSGIGALDTKISQKTGLGGYA